MRRCEMINLSDCKQGKERPKKSWNEVIKHDLEVLLLTEDLSQDSGSVDV